MDEPLTFFPLWSYVLAAVMGISVGILSWGVRALHWSSWIPWFAGFFITGWTNDFRNKSLHWADRLSRYMTAVSSMVVTAVVLGYRMDRAWFEQYSTGFLLTAMICVFVAVFAFGIRHNAKRRQMHLET